jgi:hypothetical protein
MSFIDRHILNATYVIGQVTKAQKNLLGMNYSCRNYTAIYDGSHESAIIRNSDNNIEKQ